MSWQGAIQTIVDLDGPDSPGAQPYGAYNSPGSQPSTTLVLPIVTPAVNALPARPAAAPVPGAFLAGPSGNLTGVTTYVAQVPGSPIPGVGGYYPGDTVRLFFTAAQLAAHNVIVQTAPTPTTLGTILQANAGSFGWIEIQLNAAGTAWIVLDGGYI